ncbi:MAG: hypothetical protein H2184_01160 [Candidatus Galacturonibacter soehngenii]|nr:hypothetical protein [Candidatus Galacturonibacter soehngenii]
MSDNYMVNLAKCSNAITYRNFIENKAMNIYHYTSSSAAGEIIKKSKLRFTDRDYLYDSSEGIYILEL